jgi:hypothetical protein
MQFPETTANADCIGGRCGFGGEFVGHLSHENRAFWGACLFSIMPLILLEPEVFVSSIGIAVLSASSF